MDFKYILFFNEVNKDSIDSVGGKGANLGELVNAGFPVPGGYCIGVNAYKSIIAEPVLQGQINSILAAVDWENPTDIEEKSREIRDLIMKAPVPDNITREIIGAYNKLSGPHQLYGASVAIRSSATAEDLPDASFAGQQETYLNIQGDDEVLARVKYCWASLWTTRAMSYRHKQNYEHNNTYLSVIIQKMVEAEAAGVAFTANPLNGNTEEMLINSSYGLGEVVVAGTVTPDNFILCKKNLEIKSKQLGTKEKQLIREKTGKTKLSDVSPERRKEYSLSEYQLKKLGELAIKVESHYQFPQDIEWAFAGGKLYLLQARPVTALCSGVNRDNAISLDKLTKIQKFMLGDLIEHYPQAPTPLDHAVVTTSYQAILNSSGNLGIRISSAGEIINLENNGRITLNAPRIRYSLKLLLAPIKLYKAPKISQSMWEKEYQNTNRTIEQLENTDMLTETNERLAKHLKKVFDLAEITCNLRFFNFFEANMLPLAAISMVLKLFSPKGRKLVLMELITTGLDYKTMVIDRKINDLAVSVAGKPELHAAILKCDADNLDDLKKHLLHISGGQEFYNKLETFLKNFGYRTEKMYQPFTSKSWQEDPNRLMVIIRAALQDPLLAERQIKEAKRKQEHEVWVNTFERNLRGPFKRLFHWGYNKLRANHIIREETLFTLEKIFTAGRKITSELGNRLAHAGYIKTPEDIVYFTKEEIVSGIINHIDQHNCQQLVSIRKKIFSTNQALWKDTLLKLGANKEVADVLQGISGSPGLAEGPAEIIMSVHDFSKLKKGDILVCPYTDPTWTPLFGLAAAVVADTGGPLSHAAIVAREYGIPAVLGTKVGTTCFKQGDTIVVNGSVGTVYKKKN